MAPARENCSDIWLPNHIIIHKSFIVSIHVCLFVINLSWMGLVLAFSCWKKAQTLVSVVQCYNLAIAWFIIGAGSSQADPVSTLIDAAPPPLLLSSLCACQNGYLQEPTPCFPLFIFSLTLSLYIYVYTSCMRGIYPLDGDISMQLIWHVYMLELACVIEASLFRLKKQTLESGEEANSELGCFLLLKFDVWDKDCDETKSCFLDSFRKS